MLYYKQQQQPLCAPAGAAAAAQPLCAPAWVQQQQHSLYALQCATTATFLGDCSASKQTLVSARHPACSCSHTRQLNRRLEITVMRAAWFKSSTCAHASACAHAHARTRTHTCTHAHMHTHTHTHTYIHTHAHTQTRTCTYTYTHTHTHTYTHARAHIATSFFVSSILLFLYLLSFLPLFYSPKTKTKDGSIKMGGGSTFVLPTPPKHMAVII